jgi:hypothetical protein
MVVNEAIEAEQRSKSARCFAQRVLLRDCLCRGVVGVIWSRFLTRRKTRAKSE